MSLENHVPSLELCKKWKEIGGRQDTEFKWVGPYEKWRVVTTEYLRIMLHRLPSEECYAAPLDSELMEWFIPNFEDLRYDVDGNWVVCCYKYPGWKTIRDKSLPNALMMMAIELEKK